MATSTIQTSRVIEVDVSAAAYEAGHIPGAILWNAYTDLRHHDYAPIDSAELATLLARSGNNPQDTVVFYGYGAHLWSDTGVLFVGMTEKERHVCDGQD